MTMQKQASYFPQLAFVGMMFFAIGFALGINSFLIPVLNGTLGVSSAQAYLVLAATFSTFIILGYPASMTIKKIGYKHTMALSFLLFALGFLLYIFSANYKSFVLFLVASFISGIGNTFLQASVNPYITILGPIESAARRMSIMGICNKLAWPIAPVFLAWVIGKNTTEISEIADLILPFYIIIGVFTVLGVISLFAPLPEVKAAGEDNSSSVSSGILTFFDKHWKRGDNGMIVFSPAMSLETFHWAVNPLPEVVGINTIAEKMSALLGALINGTQRRQWGKLINDLPEVPIRVVNNDIILAPAAEFYDKANVENSELYAVFPYRTFGIGKPNIVLGQRTFTNRTHKDNLGWQPNSIQAAYLGLTDEAKRMVFESFSNWDRNFRFPAFLGPNYD